MMAPRARIGSIAMSIFALVLGSVLTATAVFVAISFRGPPPRDPPHSIEMVAAAMHGETPPHPFGLPLRVAEAQTRPAPPAGMMPQPRAALHVAQLLGVPPGEVFAWADQRPIGMDSAFIGDFIVAWRHGATWRVVTNPPSPIVKRWHYVTLLAMLATILALTWPAWALARAISRPIRRIAETAGEARAGVPLGPMPQDGVGEVRVLSRAISHMHDRLSRHAEGRTTMLAAIAHDLGTPLSRLAFWIEQLPEEARVRADADLEEMRAMLGAVLRFARDESKPDANARIELGSLLDSLTEDMNVTGAPVTITPGARAIVRGDPQALRRLFANLVENAIRYGQSASVAWAIDDNAVTVTIDDEGPGFDPTADDRLFDPFVRGDPSRNRETGGTGLGLAIVRSIAEAHRGSVSLDNHPGGGRVRVTLPLDRG
ncbi:MAG: HAMP domain-containing sensor histidine kinase [Sphingomonas sp.]|jgi:signal transduction histidine kinase|uniref:sensor histidine kinase n=1 Tax=Sphingomonas sp. TaxID=28214 RepID=UPI0035632386